MVLHIGIEPCLLGSAIWETLFANLYVSFLVNELFKASTFSSSFSVGDYCPV